MEGRVGIKDVFQQFTGHRGLEGSARGDDVGQIGLPLEHHQGAHPVFRHLSIGLHRLLNGLLHIADWGFIPEKAGDSGDVVAANALQKPANLRLENDHQGQQPQLHRLIQNETDGIKVKLVGNPHRNDNQQQRLGHLGRVGPLENPDAFIEQEGQDGDVDQIRDCHQPQITQRVDAVLQKRGHRSHLL